MKYSLEQRVEASRAASASAAAAPHDVILSSLGVSRQVCRRGLTRRGLVEGRHAVLARQSRLCSERAREARSDCGPFASLDRCDVSHPELFDESGSPC